MAEYDIDNDSSEKILDYVQETEVENLFVMSAGNVPPNPSELLVSQEMSKILEELRQMCDIVIVDGTPCELVTDSVILSRMVDTTIVVTAHKMTKKDALQRVVRNIKNVGGNLAGVVINKVPVSAKKYGERYYYYGKDNDVEHTKTKRSDDIVKKSGHSHNRRVENNENEIERRMERKTERKIERNIDNEDIPKALKRKEVSSLDTPMQSKPNLSNKTSDILNQINEYLENEKKS